MGYSKDHVRRTRQRIVECAGRLFRMHGYDGVGIDTIMAEAGLTRGGFYAHFKTKRQLFEATVAEEFDFAVQLRTLRDAAPPVPLAVMHAIGYYLDPAHRERVGNACTMATGAVDAHRADNEAREAFAVGVNGVADELVLLSQAQGQTITREAALATISQCVGALILARACPDETATEILSAAVNAAADGLSSGGDQALR